MEAKQLINYKMNNSSEELIGKGFAEIVGAQAKAKFFPAKLYGSEY